MYDYVTPDKVLNALRWLKTNNPLYANVEISDEWSRDVTLRIVILTCMHAY